MPAEPISREALHRVFGPDAFAFGLFYAHSPALRFELSQHGHRLDLFEQAWDRGREIVDHAFGDARELVAVVSWFADGPLIRGRDVFRSLRACGVRTARPRACWTEPYEDGWLDEPEVRTFVAFPCERDALHRLLWGALAADLGIEPRLRASVFIADPARGILVHPYDDRGMDVMGPNRALPSELYRRFHGYLLDYDRERMAGFFGA
jgi:hypothetical protein